MMTTSIVSIKGIRNIRQRPTLAIVAAVECTMAVVMLFTPALVWSMMPVLAMVMPCVALCMLINGVQVRTYNNYYISVTVT